MTLATTGIVVGTLALAVAIVVSITGGFVIDAGPLHFSAHRLVPPCVIAAITFGLALSRGQRVFADAAARVGRALEFHAAAAAVVLAAAAAGVGIAYGTYVASGADSSGYLSQAELINDGRLTVPVRIAEQVAWPEPEWSFAPLGYRPAASRGEIVPTYPPGLPLFMALGARTLGDVGPFLIGPLCGAALVLCTFWLGARTHNRTAGLVGAALMATSALLLSQIVQPMSDIPASALWAVSMLLALSNRAIAAGAVAGAALLIRPSLLPVAGAVAVALLISRSPVPPPVTRRHIAQLLKYGGAMIPGVLALASIQWRLYGHPLASGHGPFSYLFALENVIPNIRDYTMRIVTGEAPALALLTTALLLLLFRARDTDSVATPAQRVVNPALLTLLVGMAVLVCYLPYGVFPDWAYLRFLLPAWPVALATVGAIVTRASVRLPVAIRVTVLVLAVVAVGARNVVTAANEGSFTLWLDASRYGTAGRYLDAVLPDASVVVTSQESGSVAHYTHRPVLRWDLLNADLDEAVSHLSRLGYRVVFLVEDWEKALLAQRFPMSHLARLDWKPRADIGTLTRVRLFDPADSGRASVPFDRLP